MKATVSGTCVSCGLCVSTCPTVFHMGDDGLAHGSEVPANQEAAAREAADACPVQAIACED